MLCAGYQDQRTSVRVAHGKGWIGRTDIAEETSSAGNVDEFAWQEKQKPQLLGGGQINNLGSGLSLYFLGKSYALVDGSESGKQNSERFVWIAGHIQIQTYIQSELFFHSYTVISTHVRLLCLRTMSTGRLVKHSYMLKCKHTKYINFIT